MKRFHRTLLTGGTSGLGRALIGGLLERSEHLVIVARDSPTLHALSSDCIDVLPADLGDSSALQTVIHYLRTHRVDCLINNAGCTFYEDIRISSHQDYVLHVNALAPIQLTQAALPGMLQHKKGSILNVSSIAACFPIRTMSSYPLAKKLLWEFSIGTFIYRPTVYTALFCPGLFHSTFAEKAGKIASRPSWIIMDTNNVAHALLHQLDTHQPFQIYDWRWKGIYYCSFLGLKRAIAAIADHYLAS